LTNQKQELPVVAMFVNGLGRKSNIYKGPYIDDYYEVSVHLAKRFQWRRFFRNQPIRNKNCLRQPCFLTYQDEMSNHYRASTIYASYQVSVHLAKRFQRRRFLEINRSETRIACGDHVCSRIGSKWAISIEDLPYMLPTKFRFIWKSGFIGEYFLELDQSETRIACSGHVC
jgi:hypothetical protein